MDGYGWKFGAGEGNRTLVVSLEGFCSTIELHPRVFGQPMAKWGAQGKGLSLAPDFLRHDPEASERGDGSPSDRKFGRAADHGHLRVD